MMAKGIEDTLPPRYTTDELAAFWHQLTQECVLRLVRLKPEMVRHDA